MNLSHAAKVTLPMHRLYQMQYQETRCKTIASRSRQFVCCAKSGEPLPHAVCFHHKNKHRVIQCADPFHDGHHSQHALVTLRPSPVSMLSIWRLASGTLQKLCQRFPMMATAASMTRETRSNRYDHQSLQKLSQTFSHDSHSSIHEARNQIQSLRPPISARITQLFPKNHISSIIIYFFRIVVADMSQTLSTLTSIEMH